MRPLFSTTLALAFCLVSSVRHAPADEPPVDAAPAPGLTWRSDYVEAKQAARDAARQLLIVFHDPQRTDAFQRFQSAISADRSIATKLSERFVLAWLPSDAKVTIDDQETVLLEREAFRDLQRQPGLAIVDYRAPELPHYGYVTSVLPVGKAAMAKPSSEAGDGAEWLIPRKEFEVLLDLPAGTLTQRTLIFAVRTHPDRPESTAGEFHAVLAEEATSHATRQADLRLQGHHDWGVRFHRINEKLPAGLVAVEVCAESWNGQSLLDAARECVRSWRQSSGHWNHVRERHRAYGYDMKRGSNGTWYATGIFGRGR